MTNETQQATDPSITSLITGIIDDLRDLMRQQLRLTRQEIIDDLHKVRAAAGMFILGAGMLFIGCVFLCSALPHLLHWATSPAGTDPALLPLWACYALVGLALIVPGGVLGWVGGMKIRTIHPLANPATEALKDNVKWVTHSKVTDPQPNGANTDYHS